MNNTNSSVIDEVVAHLNNSGPNFTFILITGIKCIFAVLAQLLYLSLIYVTIKTK
uniref:Uncharacterized protein n=1 Tax=Meloidogyne enterolobii TaxID=390850 RepID=A0A6V7UWQ2_MELEN|nr:unnamed protein product [Meloidogyne enterolobii]